MKTKLLACSLFSAAIAFGAPLRETTAVHTKPDASSPAITYLKAGTEPTPAPDGLANTPAGWMAIELPGPFAGYVQSKDLTKGLDIKPGTPIRTAPQPDGAVITIAERGDKSTITGLHGKWTQVSLQKKLTGYINIGGVPGYMPPIATTPASSAQPAPIAPAPVAPVAYGAGGAGQPVTTVDVGSSSMPRQFAGTFVSTKSLFHPRRPFDWALNDDAGRRFAYLDLSKLLLTEQPDKYIGHRVVVFGAPKATADGKDIVIQVESLQLQ